MPSKKILYTLCILYYAFITFLSSIPSKEQPSLSFLPQIPHFDKIIHFVLYGLWGALISYSLYRFPQKLFHTKLRIISLFVILFSLAALDEYHQSFVPGRDMDFLDFIADCAGLICFYYFVKKKIK